ncbi:MAG: toll/interleukin-1 receptor domain-containing protein [Oscillospiraceae bacterium]|nr:toll/interleukin-1 receptor domain-containing protein [Oscillospiraceae bacterium]
MESATRTEETACKYEAFISYRHMAPDNLLAKKLHTAIENFHIPASVRKASGKKRMGKVFRDEEELPLSSDLGADIKKALADSRWLIVLCSPRLPLSKWCLQEINTFLELGRADRILTLLIEGEPEESFPEQLRFSEENGARIEREPLAADVRGRSDAERAQKLRREKLRILAPMLGVGYDDLKQRAKERKLKLVFAAGLAALALSAAFSVYAVDKNNKIEAQRNAALESQSLYLSDASRTALESGDRMLSLLLALEALPKNTADPERPLTAEAEAALRSADVAQGSATGYQPVTTMYLGSKIYSYSTNGTSTWFRMFSPDIDNYIATYELASGERIYASEENRTVIDGTPYNCRFMGGIEPVLFFKNEMRAYTGSDIQTRALPDGSWDVCEGWQYNIYYTTDGGRFFTGRSYSSGGNNTIQLPSVAANIVELEGVGQIKSIRELRSGANGNLGESVFALGCYAEKESGAPTLYTYSASAGELRAFDMTADVCFVDTSSDNTALCAVEKTENAAGGNVYIFNSNSKELAYVITREMLDGVGAKEAWFTNSDANIIAVLNNAGTVSVFDYAKKEFLFKLHSGAVNVLSVRWNTSGNQILCACSDKAARIFDAKTGEQVYLLNAGFDLKEAVYASGRNLRANDMRVLLVGNSSISVYKLVTPENSADSTVLRLGGFVTGVNCKAAAFSPDGSMAAMLAQGCIALYNTSDGSILWISEDSTYSYSTYKGAVVFTPDSKRVIYASGEEGGEDFSFIARDAQTGEPVGEISPSYHYFFTAVSGFSYEEDKFECETPVFSQDGRYLRIRSFSLDYAECVFVYDAETLAEAWHFGYEDVQNPAWYGPQEVADYTRGDYNSVALESYWLDGGEKLLMEFCYTDYRVDENGEKDYRQTYYYEVRDAADGTVITSYIAAQDIGDAAGCMTSPDGARILLWDGGSLTVLDALTGKKTAQRDFAEISSCFWAGGSARAGVVCGEGNLLWDWGQDKTTLYDDGDIAWKTANAMLLSDSRKYSVYISGESAYTAAGGTSLQRIDTVFPFGEKLAYIDKVNGYCVIADAATGKTIVRVCEDDYQLTVYAAAPDGSAIVYSTNKDNGMPTILKAFPLDALMRSAQAQLGGRALTEDEKARYFIVN